MTSLRCPRNRLFPSVVGMALVVILLAGRGQPALGGPTVVSGSFSGPNPFQENADFVTEYKDGIARIADGSLASRSSFLPSELSIPPESLGGDGRSSYHVSIFDGLVEGDIVWISEALEYRFSSSDDWERFATESQGVAIVPYSPPEIPSIDNFRDFIEVTESGSFRFVKGTGLYWEVEPGDNIIGSELRVIRNFEVYRGGTLDDPFVTSRGLNVGTGVSGGEVLLSGQFIGTAVAVPEPMMIHMVSLSVLMIGSVAAIRRR